MMNILLSKIKIIIISIIVFLSYLFAEADSYDDISHFSLGLAGISDDAAREMLFKRLEECNISSRTHLTSDVNPIFEMNCSDNSAVLVNVGTGSVCIGRDEAGKLVKINDELILIANGGVINNALFRKSLADALSFDFKSIKWLFPTISTSYYPGLMSAKMLGMKININDIIRENKK